MKYRVIGTLAAVLMLLTVLLTSAWSDEGPANRVHQHLTARQPDAGCDCDGSELCTHLPLVVIRTNGQAIPGTIHRGNRRGVLDPPYCLCGQRILQQF